LEPLKNAFGIYFQFLEAGEKELYKSLKPTTEKQADLNDQLEKGFITQEVYTRKAKLEAELARKSRDRIQTS
jgi:hypothetical protein